MKSYAYFIENNSLELKEVLLGDLKEGFVRVRVRCSGVNRADILQVKGLYPASENYGDVPGLEFAGEVVESKSGKYNLNDRVIGLVKGGAYSEYVDVREEELVLVRNSALSFEELACIPESFSTAFFNLCVLGELNQKSRVLVYSAAGGVGLSALQIISYYGAEAVPVVGSKHKADFLRKYGYANSVNYKNKDFRDFISNSEDSFSHILDTVGAERFRDNIFMLSYQGSLLLIGLLGGTNTEISLYDILRKNLRIIGSTLRSQEGEVKSKLLEFIELDVLGNMVGSRPKFLASLDSVFSYKDVFKAYEHIIQSKNAGNVVLKWDI